ncbi:type IV pilus modification protein PilV [Halomonas sp. KO116]|uniref:type IV pilus modification protein PilV n=1 Tax=Halomonas sp. KO116 TaxID=1504981 RepID=UPI0004E37392|nr:type IV pilus modification protein PilV [Halomonas sp. KO116]AJY49405.1 type IV pilus modification protein PilV [Halomonas sp. KO116]
MIHQRGFSLIEALIALVVLSVGLLGVAAMQLKALQSANAGYQRSVASVAAVDAQERLWAEWARDDVNGCADIDIEPAWEADWFSDRDSYPLRNVDKEGSGIQYEGNCEFTIEIDLGSRPGDAESNVFTYIFRLPNLGEGSDDE